MNYYYYYYYSRIFLQDNTSVVICIYTELLPIAMTISVLLSGMGSTCIHIHTQIYKENIKAHEYTHAYEYLVLLLTLGIIRQLKTANIGQSLLKPV